jgi:cellulose synthase (UDP-forming)
MKLKQTLNNIIHWLLPESEEKRYELRIAIFRILAVADIFLGLYYLVWRYTSTLNMNALWFAIPLVVAETYSFLDTFMFAFMMWKPPRRIPPAPRGDETVDVFIATYNEPIELVELTARAAMRIDWKHLDVYILDDGARLEMKAKTEEIGCHYISRGAEWQGKPRHAKAGNVNNALAQTSGEFILILDADQIPAPQIVSHVVGYFQDPELAFVQTPQYFYNLPPGDPFGSDAPLFYGPIQQGKDGWNAAFFCGSNAILRREALIQLGLTEFVNEMEERTRKSIQNLGAELRRVKQISPLHREILSALKAELAAANKAYRENLPLDKIARQIRATIEDAKEKLVGQNVNQMIADLKDLAEMGDENAQASLEYLQREQAQVIRDVTKQVENAEAIGLSQEAVDSLAFIMPDEAIPVQPLATISITEDMATAMRLHAMGWKSCFHPEILAYGLAPEDLGSALSQRLRWAQGTIQVFLRENPIFIRGLSFPQRLQYVTTMYSYFNGFFSLILILSPIIYLFTGIPPVSAWSWEFALRLIPFLLLNKFIFRYIAWGLSVWRGEQYSLALFPLWIQAVVSVFTGAKLKFVVTPKQRQSGNFLPLVWVQLLTVWMTIFAMAYGLFSFAVGWNLQIEAILVNVFWGCYNIVMLSAIIRAAVYKPPENWSPAPPEFLFPQAATTDTIH